MNKENNQKKYEAVIGLEIHAELKTKSKMFCGCRNIAYRISHIADNKGDKQYAISDKPNTNICPVCLGMPGTLPVINKQAVEWTVLTGMALNCKVGHQINPNNPSHKSKSEKSVLWTKWDRKNYFYPDLPKGYQISQYDLPICYEGYLDLRSSGLGLSKEPRTKNQELRTKHIGITRIHLEEDTGTLKHPEGRAEVDYSLVDYNRAGVPLMELVTEPDLRTAQEAKEFCQKYQLILRTLKIADADMEKGQMRCEANISLREKLGYKTDNNTDSNGLRKRIKTDQIRLNPCHNPLKSEIMGTKVEVKNLNSFKSVEKAIEYEIERQAKALESGEKIVQQTRGWDEKNQKTYVMRTKETSADYRYFPEPDLPPVELVERGTTRNGVQSRNDAEKNKINIDEIRKQLPELPEEKAKRYVEEYKIKQEDAEIIVGNLEMVKYFESSIKYNVLSIMRLANWIVNEISDLSVKPEHLVELVNLIEEEKISGKIAKEILPEIKKGKSPAAVVRDRGLEVLSDDKKIGKIIDEIIKKNPEVVTKIKSGKMGVMGFLVGQVMKETKGQANPKIVNEILQKKIS